MKAFHNHVFKPQGSENQPYRSRYADEETENLTGQGGGLKLHSPGSAGTQTQGCQLWRPGAYLLHKVTFYQVRKTWIRILN